MRVRRIVRREKRVLRDTGWQSTMLQPFDAPFFEKPRSFPAGWRWRSFALDCIDGRCVLLLVCSPVRAKWQAVLARAVEGGYAVVARVEDHGSHPGLHVHADCETGGIIAGASGMSGLVRVPPAHAPHRRRDAWSEETFLMVSMRFFRVERPFQREQHT